MTLKVGQVDVALPFSFTLSSVDGTDVTSVKLRYRTKAGVREWVETPTATTLTTVTLSHVTEAGDLPDVSTTGYWFAAFFYSGATLLCESDEFRGPPVAARQVSAP